MRQRCPAALAEVTSWGTSVSVPKLPTTMAWSCDKIPELLDTNSSEKRTHPESIMKEVCVNLNSRRPYATTAPALQSAVSDAYRSARMAWLSALWAIGIGVAADSVGEPLTDQSRLAFDITEGLNINSFLRDGPVAAHLVVRSGTEPRIVVVFPAGNSGAGIWFSHTQQPISWVLASRPQPVRVLDEAGRAMYGVTAELRARGPDLFLKQAILSNVRVIRDYDALGSAPPEVMVNPSGHGEELTWGRRRLDDAVEYRLRIEIVDGHLDHERIVAGGDGLVGLRVTALSGEAPLTPLAGPQLLEAGAAADTAAQNTLTFLSYCEKLLAGSWHYNTYFGRDTLLSVHLLMPVLTPEAVESAVSAVLTRLSPAGEVAHEEDIGEMAILDHIRTGETANDTPVYDYEMIDGNYLLAPVLDKWLFDDPRGRRRASMFLAQTGRQGSEGTNALGILLVTNLRHVLHSAVPFVDAPSVQHLIGLKGESNVGQWRDSEDGLGHGRYPYDVNAVFVPAALEAIGHLYSRGLLEPYLAEADRPLFARATSMARVWREQAPPLFDVSLSHDQADRAIQNYGARLGVRLAAARASIGRGPVRFHALSLNADATTVAVENSDEGFQLLFGHPNAEAISRALAVLLRPFPAGLMTDVGLLVSNPVYARLDQQNEFNKHAYHGTVVWSWQQAVLAKGIERQLEREDLSKATVRELRLAQARLWRSIDATRKFQNSELWSWNYRNGYYQVAPFGGNEADTEESDAAQLWSTVYLAIQKPSHR